MRRLVILALVLSASAAFAEDASLASPTGDVYEVEFRFRADALAAGVPSDYRKESAAANDARWSQARTFAQDTAILKNFIAGHRAWLDEQFKTVSTLMESVRCESQTRPWDGVVIPEPTVISLQ